MEEEALADLVVEASEAEAQEEAGNTKQKAPVIRTSSATRLHFLS